MIQTLGPFVPGINGESRYLGQVRSRYILPVSHLRPRLYVETFAEYKGHSTLSANVSNIYLG